MGSNKACLISDNEQVLLVLCPFDEHHGKENHVESSEAFRSVVSLNLV